jgi:glycosyltransferase involved in cell wall biosynthesis
LRHVPAAGTSCEMLGEMSMPPLWVPCTLMPEDHTDVLAFVSSFCRFAGPNNPILDLGNHLVSAMGVRFAVVTTLNPVDPDFARRVRFPVYRDLSGASSSVVDRFLRGPANVARARSSIARNRPRRTIVFSSLDTAFEVARATRRPVLLGYNVLGNIPHRTWSKRFGLRYYRPPSWRNVVYEGLDRLAARSIVGGILAHSKYQEDLYLAMGIPAGRIRVVPHAIDVARLDSEVALIPPDVRVPEVERPRVLFVGRLEPDKGVVELLQAAAQASGEIPFVLQLVGAGHLRYAVEDAKAHAPASLRIETAHDLPLTELFRRMRDAVAVVMPSWTELFGIVALEVMGLGRPIIASKYGGVSEVIRDGVDGILVDPFDVEGLSTALQRVLSDASLRGRLGRSARERVATIYDVHAVAPRFLEAVEELA